jgi:hypothetical protein
LRSFQGPDHDPKCGPIFFLRRKRICLHKSGDRIINMTASTLPFLAGYGRAVAHYHFWPGKVERLRMVQVSTAATEYDQQTKPNVFYGNR